VQVRYQSYPYQKFGQYEGVVDSVSNASVPSSEQIGFALPDTPAGEPVFAITVRLKQQAVTAYGQNLPLQPGMRLDADVLQETRRLYEWMLEPLYSVTGKM
jgi:membrane fusion protein